MDGDGWVAVTDTFLTTLDLYGNPKAYVLNGPGFYVIKPAFLSTGKIGLLNEATGTSTISALEEFNKTLFCPLVVIVAGVCNTPICN